VVAAVFLTALVLAGCSSSPSDNSSAPPPGPGKPSVGLPGLDESCLDKHLGETCDLFVGADYSSVGRVTVAVTVVDVRERPATGDDPQLACGEGVAPIWEVELALRNLADYDLMAQDWVGHVGVRGDEDDPMTRDHEDWFELNLTPLGTGNVVAEIAKCAPTTNAYIQVKFYDAGASGSPGGRFYLE